jgi:hypothetical protein
MLGVDCFTTAGLKEVSLVSNTIHIIYPLPPVLYLESRLQIPVSEIC